jgi:hypothetical protein
MKIIHLGNIDVMICNLQLTKSTKYTSKQTQKNRELGLYLGIDEETDTLYHVFRLIDTTADVIVGINLYNYKMTISGITNLRHIHNLSYIRANNTCYN